MFSFVPELVTGKSNNSKPTGQRVFARAVESRCVDSGTKSSACLTKMPKHALEKRQYLQQTGLGKLTSMCKRKKSDLYLSPCTKKPNSDQRPKCGPLTTKTTRTDVGSTYIRGVGKDSLSRTPSVPELRPTAESWDFRELKLLHS